MSRMAAALQRRQRNAGMIAAPKSLPAPIGGWVTAQNLSASSPNTCIVLDNWRPKSTGVEVRGGNSLHATVGTAPVESLLGYVGATISKMYAAADGNIYDITSVADPEVPPAAAVSGQTSNYYASVQFTTTGGYFSYWVNGTDDALLNDGTAITPINGASTPAITGANTDTFSHVNAYRNRLYFVEKNSMIIHYLPVDSIGGAASQLNLSGIFRKGGAVYFTCTWTADSAGNSLNDYFVAVSTKGEIAIFAGSFPGGTDWSLIGTADGPRPLGINAWGKFGNDIGIATETGLITVSAIRLKDPGALAVDALSNAIEPSWREEATRRVTVPWEMAKWDRDGFLYVNTPVTSSSTPPINFIKNLQTGAWARYTGWDMRTLLVFNEQLYFGCNDGTIRTAQITGYDLDMPYTPTMGFAWDHMGNPGFRKTIRQARAEFRTKAPFAFLVSASTDYVSVFPTPPAVSPDTNPSSLWDVGLWDSALWDGGTVYVPKTTRWVSIGVSGDIFSMQLQVPVGYVDTPSAELTMIHITAEQGALTV